MELMNLDLTERYLMHRRPHMPIVSMILSVVFFMGMLLQHFIPETYLILGVNPYDSLKIARWYTFVTYIFPHANFGDWLFNSVTIVLSGLIIEPRINRAQLLAIITGGTIIGGTWYALTVECNLIWIGSLAVSRTMIGILFACWVKFRRQFRKWAYLFTIFTGLCAVADFFLFVLSGTPTFISTLIITILSFCYSMTVFRSENRLDSAQEENISEPSEPELLMIFPWTIGIYQIVCGGLSIVLFIVWLTSIQSGSYSAVPLISTVVLFLLFSITLIIAGFLLFRSDRSGIYLSIILQAIQIPTW